jgi:hypothetical protein
MSSEVMEKALPPLESRPLLLILDELDSGPARGVGSADLTNLRSAQQANADLHLLTASRGPIKAAFPDGGMGSPGFNVLCRSKRIGPMGEPGDALLSIAARRSELAGERQRRDDTEGSSATTL